MFLFLIGTLKTVNSKVRTINVPMFQFLIGTLKTTFVFIFVVFSVVVSIPHRYSKNNNKRNTTLDTLESFNSS